MSKLALSEPIKKVDNRPVIFLLVLVITAIIFVGWYAFFSGPSATAAGDSTSVKVTPVRPAKAVPSPKPTNPKPTD